MQQYLYKYLLLHHKLSIPALGNFMLEFQPAHYNESTGLLFPRKPVIDFNEGPAATADKNLVHFLAEEMGTDEITAGKEFQNFSIRLLVSMVEQHFIDLPGIGRIKKEMTGHIVFLPASNLIDILPPLRLDEKIRTRRALPKENRENTRVKKESEELPQSTSVASQPDIVKEKRNTTVANEPVKHLTEKETAELLSIIRDERKPTAKVVEMSRVTVEEEEEVIVVKDKWWIYASVLAAIGVLALLFHVL